MHVVRPTAAPSDGVLNTIKRPVKQNVALLLAHFTLPTSLECTTLELITMKHKLYEPTKPTWQQPAHATRIPIR